MRGRRKRRAELKLKTYDGPSVMATVQGPEEPQAPILTVVPEPEEDERENVRLDERLSPRFLDDPSLDSDLGAWKLRALSAEIHEAFTEQENIHLKIELTEWRLRRELQELQDALSRNKEMLAEKQRLYDEAVKSVVGSCGSVTVKVAVANKVDELEPVRGTNASEEV